jgi:hypothetical protein
MIHRGRRQITFQREPHQHFSIPPLGFLPIDTLGQTEETYITGQEATLARQPPKNPEQNKLSDKLAQRSPEILLHNTKLLVKEEDLIK